MLNRILMGPWLPERVTAGLVESSLPNIPEIQSIIAATWAEKQAQLGSSLFDGPMCRLESWRSDSEKLELKLSRTNYRTFLGTNLCHAELADRFGRKALANAVGMSAALVTADGQMVMGRRNDRVAYYPNRVHPFAGALEPADVPDVFQGIQRELEEELSLKPVDITELKMLAIIEDRRLSQPEFIFSAITSRTAAQLRESLDRTEHDALWICDARRESIDRLLSDIDCTGQSRGDCFTPVAVGTLLVYGHQLFGAEFAARHARFFER